MIAYTTGYKYQLRKEYVFFTGIDIEEIIETPFLKLDTTSYLTIKKGYSWDGPSGPTADYPKAHVMRGSLIHDALYQLMRWKLLPQTDRPVVDELMRDTFVEDGMWRWRAAMWYKSVRALASGAADPEARKEIFYAGSD